MKVPAAPLEVWVFWHANHARHAGFRDGRHPADPTMRCWHHRMEVHALRGIHPTKVVVATLGPPPSMAASEKTHEALALLGSRNPAVWVEL